MLRILENVTMRGLTPSDHALQKHPHQGDAVNESGPKKRSQQLTSQPPAGCSVVRSGDLGGKLLERDGVTQHVKALVMN
jgi:hypothetical protein